MKIILFSSWYSWKIDELSLNNNHSLTHSRNVTLYFSRKPYDIYIWRQIKGVGMDRKVGDYLLVFNWMWWKLFKWTEKWWEQTSGSWKSWDWDFAKKKGSGAKYTLNPQLLRPWKDNVTPTTKKFSVWYNTSSAPVRWCSLIINKNYLWNLLRNTLFKRNNYTYHIVKCVCLFDIYTFDLIAHLGINKIYINYFLPIRSKLLIGRLLCTGNVALSKCEFTSN